MLSSQVQSVFTEVSNGASNILTDTTTVVVACIGLLMIIFGLHTIKSLLMSDKKDKENEEETQNV